MMVSPFDNREASIRWHDLPMRPRPHDGQRDAIRARTYGPQARQVPEAGLVAELDRSVDIGENIAS